jgi:hypothetical protein
MSDNSQTLAIYNLEFIDIQNEYLVNAADTSADNAFTNWNLATINGVNDTTVNTFPVNVDNSLYPDDLFSFSYAAFDKSSSS